MGNSPHTSLIHVLDDDSLLHVFYLYRPSLLAESEGGNDHLWGGSGPWAGGRNGRWWYTLAQVCQRWRNVVLGSASYLELSLFCTFGTPVANMVAHSPPLPLVIDYFGQFDATAEDEEEAICAFKQHDRVRRVRLLIPVTSLQKFIVAFDEEYPILEYLVIDFPPEDKRSILRLPETLQAPHLRHLRLRGVALPIESRLLMAAVGLVTLSIVMVHPSTYCHPNTLLQWISLMPQLKTLTIYFHFPIPSRRELTHTPIIAPVTLPDLRHFQFDGVSTYLETLVRRITAPRLERLEIGFFNLLTFSVPRLLQFMNTAENLRFESAKFDFYNSGFNVNGFPHAEAEMYTLNIRVFCWQLDWQVSSVAQISNSLSRIFSAVEHLTLVHEEHDLSSEEHNEVDRTEWRKLFRPFDHLKTLRIDNGLVGDLARCLQLEDGELPLELLPELQELRYSGSGDTGDVFTSFIDTRQDAGSPVTLVRQ